MMHLCAYMCHCTWTSVVQFRDWHLFRFYFLKSEKKGLMNEYYSNHKMKLFTPP